MKKVAYRRINKLGKGSFGEVLLVERLSDKKLVALKKISLPNCNEEGDSVQNEVKVLQLLDHPNIIKCYEVFREFNKFCIFLEFADNGDLLQRVAEAKRKKLGYLPEDLILNWFTQTALAIKYLHDNKIIHRDIKLQNIFLTKEGLIKLGDFGISKKLDDTEELAKTSLGTPYYLSPEICLGHAYNHKSDIWMLGCALFELCTLEKPFTGESLHGVVSKIIQEDNKLTIPQQYTKFLSDLIEKMLERKPEKRASIGEILLVPEIQREMKKLQEKWPINYTWLFSTTALERQPVQKKEPPTSFSSSSTKSISFQEYLSCKLNPGDSKNDSLKDSSIDSKQDLSHNIGSTSLSHEQSFGTTSGNLNVSTAREEVLDKSPARDTIKSNGSTRSNEKTMITFLENSCRINVSDLADKIDEPAKTFRIKECDNIIEVLEIEQVGKDKVVQEGNNSMNSPMKAIKSYETQDISSQPNGSKEGEIVQNVDHVKKEATSVTTPKKTSEEIQKNKTQTDYEKELEKDLLAFAQKMNELNKKKKTAGTESLQRNISMKREVVETQETEEKNIHKKIDTQPSFGKGIMSIITSDNKEKINTDIFEKNEIIITWNSPVPVAIGCLTEEKSKEINTAINLREKENSLLPAQLDQKLRTISKETDKEDVFQCLVASSRQQDTDNLRASSEKRSSRRPGNEREGGGVINSFDLAETGRYQVLPGKINDSPAKSGTFKPVERNLNEELNKYTNEDPILLNESEKFQVVDGDFDEEYSALELTKNPRFDELKNEDLLKTVRRYNNIPIVHEPFKIEIKEEKKSEQGKKFCNKSVNIEEKSPEGKCKEDHREVSSGSKQNKKKANLKQSDARAAMTMESENRCEYGILQRRRAEDDVFSQNTIDMYNYYQKLKEEQLTMPTRDPFGTVSGTDLLNILNRGINNPDPHNEDLFYFSLNNYKRGSNIMDKKSSSIKGKPPLLVNSGMSANSSSNTASSKHLGNMLSNMQQAQHSQGAIRHVGSGTMSNHPQLVKTNNSSFNHYDNALHSSEPENKNNRRTNSTYIGSNYTQQDICLLKNLTTQAPLAEEELLNIGIENRKNKIKNDIKNSHNEDKYFHEAKLASKGNLNSHTMHTHSSKPPSRGQPLSNVYPNEKERLRSLGRDSNADKKYLDNIYDMNNMKYDSKARRECPQSGTNNERHGVQYHEKNNYSNGYDKVNKANVLMRKGSAVEATTYLNNNRRVGSIGPLKKERTPLLIGSDANEFYCNNAGSMKKAANSKLMEKIFSKNGNDNCARRKGLFKDFLTTRLGEQKFAFIMNYMTDNKINPDIKEEKNKLMELVGKENFDCIAFFKYLLEV